MKISNGKRGGLREFVVDFFSVIWKNRMSRIGLFIVLFFIIMATFGPLVVKTPVLNYANRLRAPNINNLLGTDYAGRDIFSMFVLGSRAVLVIALYAGIFSVLIACAVGITAGISGGKIDLFLTFITNIVLTVPQLPVLMILSMIINVSNKMVFGLLLSISSWAPLARAIRTQVITMRNKEFIEVSRLMNVSTVNIVIKDVLPNVVSYVAINFIGSMKNSIMASIGLMVLGLVPFDGQHWGMMIQMSLSQTSVLYGGFQSIVNFATPIFGILFFQIGCYLFAMGLDTAMNPRLR